MHAGDGDDAIFEGLAEGFENVAAKFGHFVEEQHTVVGEGYFAGFGGFAATDDCGVASGVMRRSEWSPPDKPIGVAGFSGRAVDAGDFDCFSEGEGREDCGEPPGEHGFAGSGWAGHEDVVASGGGNFEGTNGLGLTFDVVKIDGECFVLTIWLNLEFVGLVEDGAVEEFDDFEEGAEAVNFEFGDDGGFGSVGFGNDESLETLLVGHDGDVDGTVDPAEVSVEAELADDQGLVEGLRGDLTGDSEDCDGDREVEAGAFFADVGGGEITDEEAVGESESRVADSGGDAFLGFLDGFIGESDDEELGHAAAEIDFDNYWDSIDPVKSGGVSLGDHRWVQITLGGRAEGRRSEVFIKIRVGRGEPGFVSVKRNCGSIGIHVRLGADILG